MQSVTISRELGSLGTLIARTLADRLGFRLVWREVINEAAVRSGAPEVALAQIDDLGLLGLRPSGQAFQAYHEAVKGIMDDLVAEGRVVILGRAGQVILKDLPSVLHVKVIAPLPLRIDRIAKRKSISQQAARAQVEQSDRTRRCYLRRHYQVDWRDPELYDLVINTVRMDIDAAATLIERVVADLPQLNPPGPAQPSKGQTS